MTGLSQKHTAYYEAVSEADDDLEEALAHVRAEEEAGRITARQAADERVQLLENHLAECQRLRMEHLGGS